MIKMEQQRTIQDFVEDMVSDGRDLNQILTVASCCRWKDFKQEIKKECRRLRK